MEGCPHRATGELRIRNEEKVSTSCLYPFPTLFPLVLFPLAFIMLIQRMLSTLQVYCEPSPFFEANERSHTPPLSLSLSLSLSLARSRSELSLWMYTSSIKYHRLTCSFQYEKPERRKGNNRVKIIPPVLRLHALSILRGTFGLR